MMIEVRKWLQGYGGSHGGGTGEQEGARRNFPRGWPHCLPYLGGGYTGVYNCQKSLN